MDDVELTARERRTMGLSSVALALLVFLQAPGRIVPETKLDVLLDPATYLGRALTAWDPSGGFGRVQNQAVGYLFPMGAFTSLGQALSVPPWMVQRLWISLVVVLSLWGAHRVARAIGIARPSGRVVAALAYALAPATLGVTAFQSAGQLPYALAPWVLVPLLTARDGASPRRVAARSALWIVAMGGVNGASAFAVLPLVLVWFTTRTPGRDRRRLLGWWCASTALATLWWMIPLAVSVRYGIRFTDYTEQSSLTTWTESGTEILRGSGNWLAFVQTDGGPWLPGAWALSADRLAIVGSVAVAAGGLWGLARRDAPGRPWLVPALAVGATAMGVGYIGAWGGPFDGLVRSLLDGPLVPFRNVHKFAAVVRLPLALGFGHLVAVGVRALTRRPVEEYPPKPAPAWRSAAVPAVAVLLVAVAVAPAAGQLTAPGSFEEIPAEWRAAGAWLEAHDDGGRTLMVPGSAFAEFRWGRPLDEPISSIQDTAWATRDLIPLGGNGSTRLLDAIDTALLGDALPPGFVATLQRAGIEHLLVRNDLDPVRSAGPGPASIRRLLAAEPDLELVASFGPPQDDLAADRRLSSTPGATDTQIFRAIDIYEVPDPVDRVAAYPAAGAAVTSGGPEAVLDLEPELTDGRAVVLAVDEGARSLPDPLLVATDTARRRDVRFGAIRYNTTYTLTASERSPLSGEDPVDRWPAGGPEGLTSARVDGAAALTDRREPQQSLRPEQQPFHAFDGNPATAWGPATGYPGDWVEVELDEPTDIGPVTITIPETTGTRVGAVRVVTDRGEVTGRVGPVGTVTVEPPSGPTTTVRVVIDDIVGARPVTRVGISEIEIGGVDVHRPLVVPAPAPGGAEVVSLSRDRFDRFSLLRRDEQGELDREFRWGGADEVLLHGTASAAAGDQLDALIAGTVGEADPGAVTVTATSQLRRQPAFAPAAAVDGDPLTAWISEPEVATPAITLSWEGAIPVDLIDIDVLDGVADPVGEVVVTAGDTTFRRPLTASGQVSIPSTTTDTITVAFPDDERPGNATRRVAIAEVSVPALLGRSAAAPDRQAPVDLPCGQGPPVSVDGEVVPTRASTTVGALIDGSAIDWVACAPLGMDKGVRRVTATAGALLVSTLVVEPAAGVAPAPEARTVTVETWDREQRTVTIGAGDAAIIATTENANEGWEATLDGEVLTPIRVDGWRQGWRVPAGDGGTIELRFRPGGVQRIGVGIGLVALLALIGLAALRPRGGAPDGSAWQPGAARPWGPSAVYGLLALIGVALGGVVALVAVPLCLLPRRARWLPFVAAAAMLGAGVITFAGAGAGVGDTTGTFSGPAQGLAVVALLAVTASLLPLTSSEEEEEEEEAAAGSTPSIPGLIVHRRR